MSFVAPPAGADFSIQPARSFSHLKTLITTFYRDPAKPDATSYTGVAIDPATWALTPNPAAATDAARYTSYKNMDKTPADVERHRRMKDNAYFHNPSGDAAPTAEFECQVVVGAKVFPVMPLKGNTQAYYNLRKSLSQAGHGYTDITRDVLLVAVPSLRQALPQIVVGLWVALQRHHREDLGTHDHLTLKFRRRRNIT